MKKLIAFLFVLMLVAILPTSALAATGLNENEKAILEKLQTSVYIDAKGEYFKIPQSYINTAKNYFAGDCDVTDEQKNTIIGSIDAGIAIVKKEANKQNISGGKFNLSSMSEAARNDMLELGKQACEAVDLQLTYSPATQTVKITAKGSNTPVFENSAVIKTTGQAVTIDAFFVCTAVAVCMVLSGGAMVWISKRSGLLEKLDG